MRDRSRCETGHLLLMACTGAIWSVSYPRGFDTPRLRAPLEVMAVRLSIGLSQLYMAGWEHRECREGNAERAHIRNHAGSRNLRSK